MSFLFLLLVVSGAAGGLYLSSASPSAKRDTLVILSPHWEGIRFEFGRAFAESMRRRAGREVVVEWLDVGGTGTIKRYVQKGYEALSRPDQGIGVDLLFGGGSDIYELFSRPMTEAGGTVRPPILSRYDPPRQLLAAIPKAIGGIPVYDDREHRWFGTALSAFGIIYNKRIVERAGLLTPFDWQDLAAPRFQGWLASGDPSSSGSVHMVYEIILQAYGFERGYDLICRIAGNIRAFDEGGAAAPRSVALGQTACGMCIDFYGEAQVAQVGNENLTFLLPEGLTVVNPDPIGIFEGAPNRDLAEAFVEFVLGEEGQKLWFLKRGVPGGPKRFPLGRLSVREDFYGRFKTGTETSIGYNPYTWARRASRLGRKPYDSPLGRRRWGVFNALFKSTIVYAHKELQAAWQALIDARMPAEALREFGRSPVSGPELLRLAKECFRDNLCRVEKIRHWETFAREKFRRVRRLCLATVEKR